MMRELRSLIVMEIPSTETAATVTSLQPRFPLHPYLRLSSADAAQIAVLVTTCQPFQLHLCPHHPHLRLFLRLHLHFHL